MIPYNVIAYRDMATMAPVVQGIAVILTLWRIVRHFSTRNEFARPEQTQMRAKLLLDTALAEFVWIVRSTDLVMGVLPILESTIDDLFSALRDMGMPPETLDSFVQVSCAPLPGLNQLQARVPSAPAAR